MHYAQMTLLDTVIVPHISCIHRVKDKKALTTALTVDPLYLKHEHDGKIICLFIKSQHTILFCAEWCSPYYMHTHIFHFKYIHTYIHTYIQSIYLSIYLSTVSHFSYAPLFQGRHIKTKMLDTNIFLNNLLIDIVLCLMASKKNPNNSCKSLFFVKSTF